MDSWNNDVDWLDFDETVPHMADIDVDQLPGSLQSTVEGHCFHDPILDHGKSNCSSRKDGGAHVKGPLICTLMDMKKGKPCNKIYLSPKTWRRHVQTVHMNKIRRLYRCTLCTKKQKTYSRIDVFRKHIQVVHVDRLWRWVEKDACERVEMEEHKRHDRDLPPFRDFFDMAYATYMASPYLDREILPVQALCA